MSASTFAESIVRRLKLPADLREPLDRAVRIAALRPLVHPRDWGILSSFDEGSPDVLRLVFNVPVQDFRSLMQNRCSTLSAFAEACPAFVRAAAALGLYHDVPEVASDFAMGGAFGPGTIRDLRVYASARGPSELQRLLAHLTQEGVFPKVQDNPASGLLGLLWGKGRPAGIGIQVSADGTVRHALYFYLEPAVLQECAGRLLDAAKIPGEKVPLGKLLAPALRRPSVSCAVMAGLDAHGAFHTLKVEIHGDAGAVVGSKKGRREGNGSIAASADWLKKSCVAAGQRAEPFIRGFRVRKDGALSETLYFRIRQDAPVPRSPGAASRVGTT